MSRALELADRAVRFAEGDEVDAVSHLERSGLARFAGSAVHQPTLIADESVTIRVVRGSRVGTAFTNRTDDDGLRQAARRAAETADGSPLDPGWPGLPGPAHIPEVGGFDPETAGLAPDDLARLAWNAISAVAGNGLEAYGYFTSAVTELAVASSAGVAAAQAATDATVLVLAAAAEESGYADASSWRADDLDPAAVAVRAAEIARRTRGAAPLEPGTYRVVLEPGAFASLLWFFAFTSLGGLALLEGRSYLSGRLGERLYHPSFTLVDDGRDPRGFPKAFDFEGVPKQRVTLVEDGIAQEVVWDRRTAKRAGGGATSTGHALAGPAQAFGPLPLNLCVRGRDATTDDLIERTGDGIFVTRLHYLNIVDPRAGILTGMTRDGTFLIEGGKVTRPLVNLRFTTSFPDFAAKLLGLSRDVKLVNLSDFYDERLPLGALVPAAASESFTIVGTGSRPGL